jgi:CP family cyanate transporter-like MFS transporter
MSLWYSEVLFYFLHGILVLENTLKQAASASEAGPITVFRQKVTTYILITLVGFNLRSVLLGVPPVLPLIQHDLGLSYTLTGFLTALPVLVLAVGAWPSGLLAERIGARHSVSIGLGLLATGTILRAFKVNMPSLLFFTLVLSIGITMSQTAIPVLIRRWYPKQIGLVSALFSDGLILGEAVAAGITVLVMVRFLGGNNWAGTFVFWGIPIVILFVLWLLLAPPGPARAKSSLLSRQQATTQLNSKAPPAQRKRVNALHLGILVGGGSLIYFGMNAWIASYNQALHQSFITPASLLALNAAQLPVSIGVTFVAQYIAGRRWPFIVAGIIGAFAISGWLFTPVELQPLWAALLGGSGALVFTLGIALPPLLAAPHEVGRLAGITLSLTYGVAFVGPFIGGALWDLFNVPALAFVPIVVACAMLIVLGAFLPSRSSFGIYAEIRHTNNDKDEVSTLTSKPNTER